MVTQEERIDQKEQLRLSLVQVAHEPDEQFHVALLLPEYGCRRMLARCGQIDAVARTLNLDQALGAAAHGTDLFTERRTGAASAPRATEGTNHSSIIV